MSVADASAAEDRAWERPRRVDDGAGARRLTLLIHGLNYAPDLIGVPKYTTELAEWLAARGHRVHVETAPPYYPQWRVPADYSGVDGGEVEMNGVRVRRSRIYVPARPTGPARLRHHVSWLTGSAMGVIARARRVRPDIVLAIAPSLLGAPAALAAARLSGARAWLHVQDFEVESAAAAGLLRSGGRLGLAVERRILGAFDLVSSISPEMVGALKRKGVAENRRFELRNWVDAAAFAPRRGGASPARAAFGLSSNDLLCLYAGALSEKQGLETILDAARRLADDRSIRFAIFGEGPAKARLQAMSRDLPNLTWGTFAPADAFADLMTAADIHLLPQRADVADLVLPSKLTAMLASGRPVIAGAHRGTGLAREIDGCGIAAPPENGDAMAAAIRTLGADAERRDRMGREARKRALARYDKETVLSLLEPRLEQFVAASARSRTDRAAQLFPRLSFVKPRS